MYLKQHNKNTAICACTNVIKTCHGHVLNVCFSATLWTFHFETAVKRAARYIITVLQKCMQRHVFPMSLGWIFLNFFDMYSNEYNKTLPPSCAAQVMRCISQKHS